jgi:MoaA/NifB/PqqE/SkfB family radical SAM enzyme
MSGSISALWSLHARCNLRCRYCFEPFVPERRRHAGREIQLTVLSELAELRTSSVCFTGGDPFLVPTLPELIREASRLGMTVDVVTNAASFQVCPLRSLKDLNVNYYVSIDSLEDDINEYLRPGSQGRICNNTELLLSAMSSGSTLTLQIVVTRMNLHGLRSIYEWAADMKLRSGKGVYIVMSVISQPRRAGNLPGDCKELYLTELDYKEFLKVARALHRDFVQLDVPSNLLYVDRLDDLAVRDLRPAVYCSAGKTTIVVDPDGIVYPCFFHDYGSLGSLAFSGGSETVRQRMMEFKSVYMRTDACFSQACLCMSHGESPS